MNSPKRRIWKGKICGSTRNLGEEEESEELVKLEKNEKESIEKKE